MSDFKTIRDGYGAGLVEAGKADDKVVVLVGDLKDSTRCGDFARMFHDRFVQCGISEQNMMGVAAGMAMSGDVPFVNSFAVFNPGRNWDQLRVSVCYANANVKIAGHHTGLSAAEDGATHQGLEDIALTRVLPNLVVLNPADAEQAREAVVAAATYVGPVYIRLSKYGFVKPAYKRANFEIGKAEVVREGKDLTLAVSGALTHNCVEAAEKVSDKVDVEVVAYGTIKPFDKDVLLRSAEKTGRVLTVEDHQIHGGFGSVVTEVLSEFRPVPVLRHGMMDAFGQSGGWQELLQYYKLDVDGIVEKILQWSKT